jgi:predicted  nucleic acid-binding Zn-ribbon protein
MVNVEDVENTIENIRHQMHNLYKLAQNATDDETIETLTVMMKNLEKQKHEAKAMIYDIAEDEEEREAVEAEIVKFEKWVEKVQPFLTDQRMSRRMRKNA